MRADRYFCHFRRFRRRAVKPLSAGARAVRHVEALVPIPEFSSGAILAPADVVLNISVEFVVARRQSVVGRSSDAAAERRDCFHRDAIGCPVNFGIVGVDV